MRRFMSLAAVCGKWVEGAGGKLARVRRAGGQHAHGRAPGILPPVRRCGPSAVVQLKPPLSESTAAALYGDTAAMLMWQGAPPHAHGTYFSRTDFRSSAALASRSRPSASCRARRSASNAARAALAPAATASIAAATSPPPPSPAAVAHATSRRPAAAAPAASHLVGEKGVAAEGREGGGEEDRRWAPSVPPAAPVGFAAAL